ncbi:MAG: hypothetical protein JWN43_1612, partial [Gammaproteobacteria bacterium]|nr:hypothetical protein [Gammaproteobacteria bacterium]
MSAKRDVELGMDRPISRRDFVNGTAMALAGAAAGAAIPGECVFAEPAFYPPALTGMRGSGYPGAYTTAHAMRDGTFWSTAPAPTETPDRYDLIVVGGGISGLAAAYFFQKQHGFEKKVLVLDNHDDFGGHAKRNEFRSGSDLRISNAGSFNIYSGSDSSATQREIYGDLGIDVAALASRTVDPRFYSRLGMGQGVFFDKETFGSDRLLKDPAPWTDFTYLYAPNPPADSKARWAAFMAQAPLAPHVKKDLYRLYHERKDYLANLTAREKIAKLDSMSYQDY